MKTRLLTLAVLVGLGSGSAQACGFGEAPAGCSGTAESEAKYMLQRVVAAIHADKAGALKKFARGEDGFRTVDTYVFCIGPNGTMTAHPSAALRDQDVRDLHDRTGNYFVAEMMKEAKPGQISTIRYLFPHPGGTEAVPKTSYYTRAGDQVCGVGIYDDEAREASASTTEARLDQLRQKLSADMPASLAPDWSAFLQKLDEDGRAKAVALDKAREQIRAAEAALANVGG